MTPIAVRNCNPLNIRVGATWLGIVPWNKQTPAQRADTRFCVFAEPKYGFRAAAVILRNYEKDGIGTLAEAISRWAPPNENNTGAYIAAVSAGSGILPNQPINLAQAAAQTAMIKPMAIHEAGGWYWTDADLADGIALAQQ